MDDALKEFLIESHENLDQLDRDLVALEQDPSCRDSLANIFRTIHTIKGTCGFFRFQQLGALTHAGENLLSQLRDGKRSLDEKTTSVLLSLVDAVRRLLGTIEATGQEGTGDFSRLTARISAISKGEAWIEELEEEAEAAETVSIVADGTIRVEVGLLDRLMNLVGELVLARNQVIQHTAIQKDTTLLGAVQRLNLITTELQEGVMKTRMQPIATVWNKFPRLVRDLGVACGKSVHLTMDGRETELDKSIIEAIKDPLTHLIRNSIDHGLETPEERRKLGKPPEGRLTLRAFHEGGQVNIEVSDDGAGIDPARIRRKAIERGLIGRDEAVAMSDRDVLQLIFLPGFSTAASVTNVSGRGVGMDVVKTNIERISGNVEVVSRVGQGATVKLKIPLTLAIIPALIITCDGDHFAIPQVNLLELVRIEAEQISQSIEDVRGAHVHRLRGSLLPLVYLREVLGLGPVTTQDAVHIVILQAGDRPFGLVVDTVNDTEEIVVKPVGKQVKSISLYAGATILGDGKVSLILDVRGIAQTIGMGVDNREHATREAPNATKGPTCQTVVLVGAGGDRRFALPLSLVARLEEVAVRDLEETATGQVTIYRGDVLPLVHLTDILGLPRTESGNNAALQVVVCSNGDQVVGIVVDRIIDIVETPLELKPPSRPMPGVRGTTIIQGRVTEVLDPVRLSEAALSFVDEEAAP